MASNEAGMFFFLLIKTVPTFWADRICIMRFFVWLFVFFFGKLVPSFWMHGTPSNPPDAYWDGQSTHLIPHCQMHAMLQCDGTTFFILPIAPPSVDSSKGTIVANYERYIFWEAIPLKKMKGWHPLYFIIFPTNSDAAANLGRTEFHSIYVHVNYMIRLWSSSSTGSQLEFQEDPSPRCKKSCQLGPQ